MKFTIRRASSEGVVHPKATKEINWGKSIYKDDVVFAWNNKSWEHDSAGYNYFIDKYTHDYVVKNFRTTSGEEYYHWLVGGILRSNSKELVKETSDSICWGKYQYTIEVNTLEELLELVKFFGHDLVVGTNDICIYDDYLE